MNRTRWLLVLFTLVIATVGYHFWKNWGLITINSEDQPLSKVIRSIASQGHVRIESDLDSTTKVRMHVKKVSLADALETLATVTDSRWRLAYVFAGDSGTIRLALDTMSAGTKLEGWKTLFYPLPGLAVENDTAPIDPRRDTWNVKTPAEKKLQDYLDAAARGVSAAFYFPESWNPDVTSEPASGEIRKVAAKLAGASHSRQEEVFLVLKSGRPPGGERGEEGGGLTGPPGGRLGGAEAMAQRVQAEIDKLPAAKRPAAQAEFDERKNFFMGMRDLSPVERLAKMEEFFNKPENQDRMEQGLAQRDARMSPAQRVQQAQRYVQRKSDFRAGSAK